MKQWTEEETLFIKNYYSKKGGDWVAEQLGRTYHSVMKKAQRLNLKCPYNIKVDIDEVKSSFNSYYLMGIFLTDGCVTRYDNRSIFSLESTDLDIVEKVNECFKSLIGQEYSIQQYDNSKKIGKVIEGKTVKSLKKTYRIQSTSKILSEWLISSTSYKSHLPEYIWDGTREELLELLSGIWDGDGWISVNKDRAEKLHTINSFCQLGLGGITNSYMIEIPRLLDKLNIRHKVYHDKEKNFTTIKLYADSAIKNGFKFYCNRKQEKLDEIKNLININMFRD